jgi:hypothetical protein
VHTFFVNRITHFYENTVPEMYRQLEILANKEDSECIYVDLKHKLDVTRVELLKVFHNCMVTCLNSLLEQT